MTNDTILNSKQYVKNGIYFPSPSEILQPVFDTLGTGIELQGSHEITIGEDEKELTAYGRVAAIKRFDIDEETQYSIGFIYSLDNGKPFIKVFSGVNVRACTNLCIFNASHIAKFDILTNKYGSYEALREYMQQQTKNCEDAKKIIADMKSFSMTLDEAKNALGNLLHGFSATKNIAGTNCLLSAAKLMTDKDSSYFWNGIENRNAWDFYNALTDGYRDKIHILDQPEKVLSLYREIKNITLQRKSNRQLAITDKAF